MTRSDPIRPADSDLAITVRRVALRLGALYWTATFVTDSITWGLAGIDPFESAAGKLLSCTAGALVCFGLSALLYRLRGLALMAKALLCFVLALLAAPVFALLDFAIHSHFVWPAPIAFDPRVFGTTVVSFTANFFGWCCLFVALIYSFQVRDQERRLAASREEALAAQMRALRYQINPHFLFNTLNSVAALIEEDAPARAHRMVLSLSDFLHTTLRLDPQHDVRLADEIALQRNYLDIERERFPDRIAVETSLPDALASAMVPSLILQPLIENAVKHGLGAGPGLVRIAIGADEQDGRLNLWVENDVPLAMSVREGKWSGAGLGIGLRNVAERIGNRFAGEGDFRAGMIAPSRYRAALTIPLRHPA